MGTNIEITLLIVVLSIACLCLLKLPTRNNSGIKNNKPVKENSEEKANEEKMQEYKEEAGKIVWGNSSTYGYKKNSRFNILSSENIDDGTRYGINLSVILDTKTKVTYLQTEKFSNGYGVGLHVLLDADGKPLIN